MDKSLIFFGFNVCGETKPMTLEKASMYIKAIINDIVSDAKSKTKQLSFSEYGYIHPIEFEVHKASGKKNLITIGTFAFVCNDIESFRKLKLMIPEKSIKKVKADANYLEVVHHDNLNMARLPERNNHIVRIRYDSSLKINDKTFNTFYNVENGKVGYGFATVL